MQCKATTSGGEMIFQRAAVNLQFTCQLWRLIHHSAQPEAPLWLLKQALGRDLEFVSQCRYCMAHKKSDRIKIDCWNWGAFGDWSCAASKAARVSVGRWHSLGIQAGLHFSIKCKRGHADARQRPGHCAVRELAKQLAVGAVGPIRLIHPVCDLPAGCIEGNQLSCSLICCGELKLGWSEYIIKYVNLQCKVYTFIFFSLLFFYNWNIVSWRFCVGTITWVVAEGGGMSVV